MNKLAAKVVIVCCDRPLLAHSANFSKFNSYFLLNTQLAVAIIFSVRLFCAPPRLLLPGATAPLCPPPPSYATVLPPLQLCRFLLCTGAKRALSCLLFAVSVPSLSPARTQYEYSSSLSVNPSPRTVHTACPALIGSLVGVAHRALSVSRC